MPASMYRYSQWSEMKPIYNSLIMNTHLPQKMTQGTFPWFQKELFPWSVLQPLQNPIQKSPFWSLLLLTSSSPMMSSVFLFLWPQVSLFQPWSFAHCFGEHGGRLACPHCVFLRESFKSFCFWRVDYLQDKLPSPQFWAVIMIIKFPALYFTRDCLNPKGYGGGQGEWERRKVGKERKENPIISQRGGC